MLFQEKRRVATMYKYLLAITACLLVFAGSYWFDSKRSEEITNFSYHGLWEQEQKHKTVKVAVSFDLDNNLALIKLTKKEMLSDNHSFQDNARLIKMNLRAFLYQTLVMAHIGQQKVESNENPNLFDTAKMLSIATYYNNGRLTLILDEEDVFGDSDDKMIFIMNKDRG
ncbi:hypothetical protein [Enterobacter ludwigii]|uniref:hypothetical protein n=1 Tax=Enterobacter ludwigii TaxID=299767 RepID=UPI003975C2C6